MHYWGQTLPNYNTIKPVLKVHCYVRTLNFTDTLQYSYLVHITSIERTTALHGNLVEFIGCPFKTGLQVFEDIHLRCLIFQQRPDKDKELEKRRIRESKLHTRWPVDTKGDDTNIFHLLK